MQNLETYSEFNRLNEDAKVEKTLEPNKGDAEKIDIKVDTEKGWFSLVQKSEMYPTRTNVVVIPLYLKQELIDAIKNIQE